MKYSYHTPVTYTRTSQYTPTSYTSTHHTTPTHYTATTHTSSLPSTSKYTPASNYSTTHYTPSSSHYSPSSSHYTPSYKSAASSSASSASSAWSEWTASLTSSASSASSAYVPTYTRGNARGVSTHRKQAQDTPAPPVVPVVPVAPAKRAVHFTNDIVFQDIVRHGDMEQIGRFMRARKVRIDTLFHSGMAALHEAVLTGNLDVVKLLVKYGADVHQRDEDGWTPLHMACSDGFPKIARYLLSAGASREAKNASGEKPQDLIDPDCKELAWLFETGCV
ncbi:hypothetical protein NHX12_031740 [Muraenolepis orangiensis]|uniref:Protein phosphatase 1 regulatory subunit 27 n=1 Tax=Muraenolepis orangiensis TaxID=630683 RepID=A0A9Q0E516_9TELE|nr:hypothetical protein NHX12_031740 [Muraenolepis orangiensis]